MAHRIDVDETRDAILRAVDENVRRGDLVEADLLDDALTLLNRFEGFDIAVSIGGNSH